MEVEDMAFLLERLHEDCAPLQYLRELTRNGIEAIARSGRLTGELIWDVDWLRYDLADEPVFKLALIDTGCGMTGEEMERYINRLSSSIGERRLDANYGLGAKISAVPLNPEGMLYLSWQAGTGYMTHLWKDPDSGQYGLKQFERPDGTFGNWTTIEDEIKPDVIENSGTMVVLLGSSEGHDTVQAPRGIRGTSRWVAKYLNTRFFRFPDGITVKAREGWEHPRDDADRNHLREILGQSRYLDDHAKEKGVVQLSTATAHWWLLKDEKALTSNSGYINSSGHIAALYQDELYETETATAGYTKLQRFGVLFGVNRVVLYLEPDSKEGELTTNTARTQLLLDSEPLPWHEWAAEFREDLPQPIQDLVDGFDTAASDDDINESIRSRLKAFRDLFKLSRYRPSPRGDIFIDERTVGGSPRKNGGRRQSVSRTRTGDGGGRGSEVYALFQKPTGVPAKEISAGDFPTVLWVSVADGTRIPPQLEDRGAEYLPEQHIIKANADFRLFTDTVERWKTRYGAANGSSTEKMIEAAVKSWIGQQLVEAVTGALELRAAKHWTSQDIESVLSPEALSAVLMPRSHLDTAVGRELGRAVGSLKN